MIKIIFYSLAAIGLIFSFIKSKEKTKIALKKALKAFENIMPQFLGIILLIGLILSMLSPGQISQLMGEESGWLGTLLGALVGAITLMPSFVAFPLCAALLESGAGYMQIGAFISSLTIVGVVTFPIEMLYFGKKAALIRNTMGFIFSLIIGGIIGMLL